MSTLLPIHNCMKMASENESLHKKVKNLKIINDNLIVQLNEFNKSDSNLNVYSKKRYDTATQTDEDSEIFESHKNYEVIDQSSRAYNLLLTFNYFSRNFTVNCKKAKNYS